MLSQRNGCLLLVCVIFISCLLPGVTFGQRIESVLFAYAKLYATTQTGAQYNLTGSVTFSQVSQTDSRINVTVNISGNLPPNTQYGLHIDQYGDISDLAGGNLGGSTYVGSGSVTPGCPPAIGRREGDLGNWQTNSNGGILSSLVIPLGPTSLYLLGEYSVVGMSVGLHSQPDDCVTDNSSPLLMQGVIGIMNLDNNFAEYENEVWSGVAVLMPTPLCPRCSGIVWLTQTTSVPGVTVTARITGVPTTPHEINIHQFGDMSTGDESAMGAHYNPNGRPHNLPPAMPRHMGDLGNIQTYDSTGVGWYQYTTANIPDIHEVLGRSVVIDSDPDHGIGAGCDQDGNAGPGLLVGIIGIANPQNTPPTIPVTLNNVFTSIDCSHWTDAHPGLTAAVIIGWVLAALLLILVVGMLAYYFMVLKARSGYEEFH